MPKRKQAGPQSQPIYYVDCIYPRGYNGAMEVRQVDVEEVQFAKPGADGNCLKR